MHSIYIQLNEVISGWYTWSQQKRRKCEALGDQIKITESLPVAYFKKFDTETT